MSESGIASNARDDLQEAQMGDLIMLTKYQILKHRDEHKHNCGCSPYLCEVCNPRRDEPKVVRLSDARRVLVLGAGRTL